MERFILDEQRVKATIDNYKRIKDLNNKVIRHLDISKYEGLEKAIDKLNKNISFESKILNDSSELLTSLEEKSIDAIILEDAQLEILKEANDDLYKSIRKLDAIKVEIKNEDMKENKSLF